MLPGSTLSLGRLLVGDRVLFVLRFSLNGFLAKMYTEDHEAVIYDDQSGIGTVTITDYAQSSLGDVVFVELPMPGTRVEQGGK
jgi:hypothetical protein